ncbi:MAG: cytochrome c biogenesis protein [bacterium]
MKKWLLAANLLLGLAVVLVPLALYWDFIRAPEEAVMGHAQRLFYIHLPMWFVTFTAYGGAFIFSIIYLVRGKPVWDSLAAGWVEVGVLFNSTGLLTGMIWAKYAWGTWWTWDPRLTATFIMWFLYVGYLLLRVALENPNTRARMCAILSVIAFLDIPIIVLSVRLWRGIHPCVINCDTGGMSLDPVMRKALGFSVLAFWVVGLAVIALRSAMALAELKLQELRAGGPAAEAGGGEARPA